MELPKLQGALAGLGKSSVRLGAVDENIDVFVGRFASFGFWSYDSAQVDDIEKQLRHLEKRLHEIKGDVEPDYTKHKHAVFSAIAKRRDELRSI